MVHRIVAVAGAGAGVVAAGAMAQRIVDARVDRLPVPGRFVDVGGVSVHVADTAGASDVDGVVSRRSVVVAESGLGGTAADWERVRDHLGEQVRLVAVDRPGLGRSGPGRAPDVAGAVDRLEAVLGAFGVRPPVVLAGWSLGGLLDVGVALRRPDLVSGLLLVDPSHPDEARRFDDPALTWYGRLALHGLAVGARLGGAALAGVPARLAYLRAATLDGEEPLWQMPAYATSSSGRALAAELLGFPAACDEVSRLRSSQGDEAAPIPVVVLSATRRADQTEAAAWREMHADLARWFGPSEVRAIDGSGHDMLQDRPDEVARAIEGIVATSAVLSSP